MAPTKEGGEKRGRGRPPKPDSEKKPPYVPTGRPRGRPKGSGGVKKAVAKPKTTTTDATGERRERRGRPRGSTSAASSGRKSRKSDASTAADGSTPKKAATKASKKAAGSSRKNRKSDVAANGAEDVDEDEKVVENELDLEDAEMEDEPSSAQPAEEELGY